MWGASDARQGESCKIRFTGTLNINVEFTWQAGTVEDKWKFNCLDENL